MLVNMFADSEEDYKLWMFENYVLRRMCGPS